MEKKNNILKLLLVIFVITTLSLSGYILFGKDEVVTVEKSKVTIDGNKDVNENSDKEKTESNNITTNEDNNKKQLIFNEEEILVYAKSKIDRADDFLRMSGDGESLKTDDAYFFVPQNSTKAAYESEFYDIFSKELKLDDVFVDKDNEYVPIVPSYIIKDGMIYVAFACNAGSPYTIFDNYKVESVSSDKIVVSYYEFMEYDDFAHVYQDDYAKEEMKEKYDEYLKGLKKYTLELVKEDGDYKIKKALLLDACGGGFEIRK